MVKSQTCLRQRPNGTRLVRDAHSPAGEDQCSPGPGDSVDCRHWGNVGYASLSGS